MMLKLTHRLIRPAMAVFVGASTTLAFAPYSIWPLAIISPALLLLLLNKASVRSAALTGFFWGLGQFATGISWVQVSIDNFGGMPKIASLTLMFLLVSYLSLYPMLFAGLLNRYFKESTAIRFFLAAPALWLISDFARGWIMTGFPWLWLGYSQIDSPLSSLAPVGGVQLITLAILLCSSALAYSLLTRRFYSLLLPVAVFGTAFGLSQISWVQENQNEQTKISLIQGNISQQLKWLPSQRWPTLMKYLDLSRKNWASDIIIWPEAAIPALEKELPSFLRNVDSAARQNNSALITGVVTRNDKGRFYNSIITLGENSSGEYDYKTQPRYNKHHLLPFGEFVPFEEILRPLAPLFNLPMSSFSRGDYIQQNVIANGRHLAPALCYEIIFSDQVRKNVTEQTDFILTLSNDAWFGHSIGPLQHMEMARMRALELGKPLIRSTNNGVTGITDYQGKIIAQVPQFETQVLTADVASTTGMTPYHTLGNWLVWLFLIVSAVICFFNRRKLKSV